MNKTNIIDNISFLVAIFVVLALFLLTLPPVQPKTVVAKTSTLPVIIPTPQPQFAPALEPTPLVTPYPKPSYIPVLRPYLINKEQAICLHETLQATSLRTMSG